MKYIIGLTPIEDTDWGWMGDEQTLSTKRKEWESTFQCNPLEKCYAYWENNELKYSNDYNLAQRFISKEAASNFLFNHGSTFLAKSKYHKIWKVEN